MLQILHMYIITSTVITFSEARHDDVLNLERVS
jgi:hypothetical protein